MNHPSFIYQGHPHQKFGHITYSQHGEDLIFMNLCKQLDLKIPTYLDLGAYHPIDLSNTALLYQNGGHGINVEPNPIMHPYFDQDRERDINIRAAVALENGTASYYIESSRSVLNSLVKDSFKMHSTEYSNSIEVRTFTLKAIVDDWFKEEFPDFLMMDIEGLDYAIFDSADFSKSKPKVICIELQTHSIQENHALLEKKGYRFLCKLSNNYIAVANEFYYKCL